MAINPISSNLPPIGATESTGIGKPAVAGQEKPAFSQTLQSAMAQVNDDQTATTFAIQDLLAGRTQDVLPAVAAVAQADLSFKLLMGVRNKVIEAYKQTINMQV